MPSWNIHTAHVERLLREGEPLLYGVRDANAFLFGNLVPDVYVGYMVKGTTRAIDYAVTHLTDPEYMPLPGADEFWDAYIAGRGADEVSDVTLGAWAHLAADNRYNAASRRKVASLGLTQGDNLRVRKQADFDAFGRSLDIAMVPGATGELVGECAAFPQYPIAEPDVLLACEAAAGVVLHNAEAHVGSPEYQLLDDAFFSVTFDEVNDVISSRLRKRARALGMTDGDCG